MKLSLMFLNQLLVGKDSYRVVVRLELPTLDWQRYWLTVAASTLSVSCGFKYNVKDANLFCSSNLPLVRNGNGILSPPERTEKEN